MPVDSLVSCCVFRGIDDVIISWIRERLEAEDTDTRLGGKSIPEVCVLRRKMHFGSEFRNRYFVLENAYWLVQPEKYQPLTGIKAVVKQYTDKTAGTGISIITLINWTTTASSTICASSLKISTPTIT